MAPPTAKPVAKAPSNPARTLPTTMMLLSLAVAGAAVAWRVATPVAQVPVVAAPALVTPPPPAPATDAPPLQEGAPVDGEDVLATTGATFAGMAASCDRAARTPLARVTAPLARTPTLAYVTPWNPEGGDAVIAAAAAGLVTHVVPVTYQLVSHDGSPALSGSANATLLSALTSLPPSTRPTILPRVSFELSQAHMSSLLGGVGDAADVALGAVLAGVTGRKEYGGLTLDAPDLWSVLGLTKGPSAANAAAFIARLSAAVRGAGGVLAMAIPPASVQDVEHVYRATLARLAPSIDLLSVTTYEYPDAALGAAPLAWARATASLVADAVGGDRARVLVGVPLHAVRAAPPTPGARRGLRGTATGPAALAREGTRPRPRWRCRRRWSGTRRLPSTWPPNPLARASSCPRPPLWRPGWRPRGRRGWGWRCGRRGKRCRVCGAATCCEEWCGSCLCTPLSLSLFFLSLLHAAVASATGAAASSVAIGSPAAAVASSCFSPLAFFSFSSSLASRPNMLENAARCCLS